MQELEVKSVTMRPNRDNYFLDMAEHVATRATCSRLKVGAVLVDMDNRVISTGYNSSHKGTPHCDDVGCLLDETGHCIRCVHAEPAAYLNARDCPEEFVCYVTHEPCWRCYQFLAAAGCKKVYFRSLYPSKTAGYIELKNLIGMPLIHVPKSSTAS